jgi:modification methylase
VVARRLGRRFLGIEADAGHARLAASRIAATPFANDAEIVAITPKRQEPRIPFGLLVERGLIPPGTRLFDLHGRLSARVRADGSVIGEAPPVQAAGSIHQVGAALQGAPSCNGWLFWHVRTAAGLVPIDVYRQKVRAETA